MTLVMALCQIHLIVRQVANKVAYLTFEIDFTA